MSIYTRTGDKGKTSLFDGSRVVKFDPRVETYGTVDELNSFIGAVASQLETQEVRSKKQTVQIKTALEQIQNDLLDIGSALATPAALPVTGLQDHVKEFEELIDDLTAKLPELKNFILPGGSKAGALLHVCRTVCRRAERRVVQLRQTEDVDQAILVYLNRLSDLFFTLARYVNWIEKAKEVKWRKK